MDEFEVLKSLPQEEQLAVFTRLIVFLRSTEIEAVMERIAGGEAMYEAHRQLGLLEKYRGDLRKLLFGGD